MDIQELVEQARNGDRESFGHIYDLFADQLFRYISIRIQNRDHAEDILQEVFIKAWKNLHTLKNEKLQFRAWMFTIASNATNDYFRRAYRTPETVELTDEHDIHITREENIFDEEKKLKTLREAMMRLPVQYREVLQLRFIEEFSIDEVAKVLQKSNLAVRLIQFRAVKNLRNFIQSYDI